MANSTFTSSGITIEYPNRWETVHAMIDTRKVTVDGVSVGEIQRDAGDKKYHVFGWPAGSNCHFLEFDDKCPNFTEACRGLCAYLATKKVPA